MKKKLLTLVTLAMLAVSGAWATDFVLSASTKTADESGKWTFVSNSQTFTIECDGQSYAAGSGTTAGYIKMNRNKTWTVNLPDGLSVTSLKVEGWSNKSTGSSTVTEINGDTNQSYTYPNTSNSAASNTYTFAAPVTGSFTFKTGGDNQLVLKFTLTGTVTPSLTGSWSVASNEFYQGDAAPAIPTFTVGASDDSTPASSAYNVEYSLKEGSTAGIVTLDASAGITAISNTTVGTATVVATLTTANADNYLTPATNTFEYTVTVKAKAPELTLDKESVTLKSTPVTRDATATVNLTGAFLTGTSGTVAWTAVDGLTITPTTFAITNGAASQEFTITYNKDVATSGSVEVTFSDGTTSKVLTVNYSSVVPHVATSVSSATTWDWSVLSVSGDEFKLTSSTTPTKDYTTANDIVATDFNGEVYPINVGFPEQFGALSFGSFEYPARKSSNDKFFQGTVIKFTNTIPGKIEVTFSNTGGNAARCLSVDEVAYKDVSSSAGGTKVTVTVPVAAAEHVLKGSEVSSGAEKYLRIHKMIFTPMPTEVSGTITASGYNTYSSNYPLDLSTITGATAYVATSVTDGKVVLEKCEGKVPAATGLFIAGTAGATFTIGTTSDATTAPAANLLVGAPNGTTVNKAADGEYNYVFGWTDATNPGFYLVNDVAASLPSFKAYLHTTSALTAPSEARLGLIFSDEATGINTIDHSSLTIDSSVFDLQGRHVAQPTKGLYIVNGKKVVIK